RPVRVSSSVLSGPDRPPCDTVASVSTLVTASQRAPPVASLKPAKIPAAVLGSALSARGSVPLGGAPAHEIEASMRTKNHALFGRVPALFTAAPYHGKVRDHLSGAAPLGERLPVAVVDEIEILVPAPLPPRETERIPQAVLQVAQRGEAPEVDADVH